MDPNNNQPINTNPLGQPVPPAPEPPIAAPSATFVPPVQQPISATPSAQAVPPAAPTATSMPYQNPNNGSKKGVIFIVILLILIAGMVFYVLFAKKQLNTAQKTSTNNTSVAIPTATIAPTAAPTPATVDQVNVESPDSSLKDIEGDVQEL